MTETDIKTEDPRVTRHKVLQELETRRKNHLIAFFLCLLFGFWGAHRFYLGDKKQAYLMAAGWTVLLIFTVLMGFLYHAVAGAVWGYGEFYASLALLLTEISAQNLSNYIPFLGSSVYLEEILTPKWMIASILRLAFGCFVVWELFRIIGITDRTNEGIRRIIEKEHGL